MTAQGSEDIDWVSVEFTHICNGGNQVLFGQMQNPQLITVPAKGSLLVHGEFIWRVEEQVWFYDATNGSLRRIRVRLSQVGAWSEQLL